MLKKGFNLIELAIVLAVIGLVIGGIYTAASAVSQRNLIETYDKQVYTIMSNMRTAYHGQTPGAFLPIPYTTLKALKIMPGDVIDNGFGYVASNNYPWTIFFTSISDPVTGSALNGVVLMFNLPQKACITFLLRHYGTPKAMQGENILYAVTGATPPFGGTVNSSTGVTVNAANILCGPGDNVVLLAGSVL